MRYGDWLWPRLLDFMMRELDERRAPTVGHAEGPVLEIGFGTGAQMYRGVAERAV